MKRVVEWLKTGYVKRGIYGKRPPCPVVGSDEEAVEMWLREMGMEQYVEMFRSHAVDVDMLKMLSVVDLRDRLGVLNLENRRQIYDGIVDIISRDVTPLPEDGRILSHLNNVSGHPPSLHQSILHRVQHAYRSDSIFRVCRSASTIHGCAVGFR